MIMNLKFGQKLLIITSTSLFLSGCFLTKVVTTPMRIVGEVASNVPVVGEVVDGVIDTSADIIDFIPL
jgi:hypothetical protein